MRFTSLLAASALAGISTARSKQSVADDQTWIDWKTYKANGVNLGSWLEKERTHDPVWWVEVGGQDAPDGIILQI